MADQDALFERAREIETLETQGMKISEGWYQFEPGEKSDIQELAKISTKSLNALTELSEDLSRRIENLKPGEPSRESLQYAYNLAQELIQSRQAIQEMLENVLAGRDFKEYFRALSIKEKAASKQAATLKETLEKTIH